MNYPPLIKVENLTYSYPDHTLALSNLNFSIQKGETVGIIGPNGAGKTTLLLHFNGILKGDGHIYIGDEEVNKRNRKKIRSQVGIVFQDPNDQLFMPTIFDDVAFGLFSLDIPPEEIKERVNFVLNRLNILSLKDKSAFQISLGERKKASLATVMVMNPKIIIFDEPTVSLDPASRRIFIQIIKKIPATKIIASHDLDMIYELCGTIMVLNGGKLIATGNRDQVLENKALMVRNKMEIPPLVECRITKRRLKRLN